MSRSQRLIKTVQYLRAATPPVRAEDIAQALGVSVRSVYRDVDTLRQSGAVIDGEAGYGYSLEEDPALAPTLFSSDEMEALVLGLREVSEVGDPVVAAAARAALEKVEACLPDGMRLDFRHALLHARQPPRRPAIGIDVAALRAAIRQEQAVDISYMNVEGNRTDRRVLPLTIVFMDQFLTLLSWCKLRDDFRAFRIDRIIALAPRVESFRPRRMTLLRQYLGQLSPEEKRTSLPTDLS